MISPAYRRAVVVACLLAPASRADEPSGGSPPPLAAREAALARQYRELERSFLRLADLLDATDPRRAVLLRDACARASRERVADRLDAIVALLEQGQLLKAGTSQQDSLEQLRSLLDLLVAGADRSPAGDAELVRGYLARLARSIARQRDIQGTLDAGADEAEIAARQEALADDTTRLAADVDAFARRGERNATPGEPAPGDDADAPAAPDAPPDGGPAPDAGDDDARAARSRSRLEAAAERMRDARARLAEAQRSGARRDQERALEELEAARAELEEILRQLREEEVERLLVQLEARVRDMLRAQRGVQEGVAKLAAAETAPAARQREIEAANLGRAQQGVGASAARALDLVREDGSAVAIPQALEQIRDDATQAAGRLARADLGAVTRGLLDDLVIALEELLAAFERSRREPEAARAAAGGGRPGEPAEQPLVDGLAELRMIRALQARVNARTDRLVRLLGSDADRVDAPEIRAALDRLAERQRQIERACRDIVAGRTE